MTLQKSCFSLMWLAACLFLSSNAIHAATYFVAPNGNDANPGTEAQPWATVYRSTRYGGNYRMAGDTVILRGGVYSGPQHSIDLGYGIGNSGTADSPIIIKAFPGEMPVITDIKPPSGSYAPVGVILKGKSFWVFDGITWSNNYRNVALSGCTNIVFRNCTFRTSIPSVSAWASVLLNENSQLNKFLNCKFLEWGYLSPGTSYSQDIGTHISLGNGVADTADWYNLVEGCTFIGGGHDQLAISTAYNVIRSNLFVNAPWIPTNAASYTMNFGKEVNHYGAYGNRQLKPGDGDSPNQLDMRNVYEYNTFLYTGPPPDDNGAFGIELVNRLAIIRYNTIAYSLTAGLYLTAMSRSNFAVSNTIYGNTIYGNGLAKIYGGVGMSGFAGGVGMNNSGGYPQHTNNWLVNNIVWNNYPTNITELVRKTQIVRTNWTGDEEASSPLFLNTNGLGVAYQPDNMPNFRLRPGSPCIDRGDWLAYVTSSSGTGSSFTVDNSLYFSDGNKIVEGDTIQLQGQTNTAVIIKNDWQKHTLHFTPPLTWTNGQGVSTRYSGSAPDMGAFETPTPPVLK